MELMIHPHFQDVHDALLRRVRVMTSYCANCGEHWDRHMCDNACPNQDFENIPIESFQKWKYADVEERERCESCLKMIEHLSKELKELGLS